MQFVDLKKQYEAYKTEIDTAIKGVIDTTSFINGPAVGALETELSNFAGVKHSIGCASGTDALLIAMMALDVLPDDEIIVPAFTYIASASQAPILKAKPVFVDVDPVTFNIDVSKIEEKITKKTVGIIPVSLYGQCADIDAINAIAAKHDLWVMEDGAQSFGASYKGKKSCSMTTVSTTSFFPAKPLGCFGDGGAIFTNDDVLAEKIKIIKNQGQTKRYFHKAIGVNGRIDTLQAAITNVKLKHFEKEIAARDAVAKFYTEALGAIVDTPKVLSHNISTWAQYTIRVKNRPALIEALNKRGIPTAVHYPRPLPKQEAFAYLNDSANYSVSDQLADTVLSLPMHAFLTESDIQAVCSAIKEGLNV